MGDNTRSSTRVPPPVQGMTVPQGRPHSTSSSRRGPAAGRCGGAGLHNENLAPPQIKNFARGGGKKVEEGGENVQGEIKDINKRLQDLQTFINQANGAGGEEAA